MIGVFNKKTGYNGNGIDSFDVKIVEDTKDRPSVKGKVLLSTPHVDYFFTKEQWREFMEKISKVKV